VDASLELAAVQLSGDHRRRSATREKVPLLKGGTYSTQYALAQMRSPQRTEWCSHDSVADRSAINTSMRSSYDRLHGLQDISTIIQTLCVE
jgi:hypothetical protein